MIEVPATVRRSLAPGSAFDVIMDLEGKTHRQHKNRRTIEVVLGGRSYFVKIHAPSGWREIMKNVSTFRLPVLSATPEHRAIQQLETLGVRTVRAAGYGLRGVNPAQRESFIITEALLGMVHLDGLVKDLADQDVPTRAMLTRTIAVELGRVARHLHTNGLNHRDFYLVHFMLPDRDWASWTVNDPLDLHVIDLHRMQIRSRTPRRWIVKDLAGLLFSALDSGTSTTEYIRFMEAYWDRPWSSATRADHRFCRQIIRRAVRHYRHEHGKWPPLPAGLASYAGSGSGP